MATHKLPLASALACRNLTPVASVTKLGAKELNGRRLFLNSELPKSSHHSRCPSALKVSASLEVSASTLVQWAARTVAFYALVKFGMAGKEAAGPVDLREEVSAYLFGSNEARKAKEAKRGASRWHESTRGTLVRKCRVQSASEGRRVLRALAGLLSEDDLFLDGATHKGCTIRRETAHSESACCNNVRILFDELPTPHVEVEITVFPAGPLGTTEYQKAERIEKELQKGRFL